MLKQHPFVYYAHAQLSQLLIDSILVAVYLVGQHVVCLLITVFVQYILLCIHHKL